MVLETCWKRVGNVLCIMEDRFSENATEFGHLTVDHFRIILQKDAPPVKQRPYRQPLVLAAKVRYNVDRLLLAGILSRSCSDRPSSLVVVAEANGKIRLTCNYNSTNSQLYQFCDG